MFSRRKQLDPYPTALLECSDCFPDVGKLKLKEGRREASEGVFSLSLSFVTFLYSRHKWLIFIFTSTLPYSVQLLENCYLKVALAVWQFTGGDQRLFKKWRR